MPDESQLQEWKDKIDWYKKMYAGLYRGKQPSDKLIASFCRTYAIPWPLPEPDTDWDFLN